MLLSSTGTWCWYLAKRPIERSRAVAGDSLYSSVYSRATKRAESRYLAAVRATLYPVERLGWHLGRERVSKSWSGISGDGVVLGGFQDSLVSLYD
jgi:hypothetical protein